MKVYTLMNKISMLAFTFTMLTTWTIAEPAPPEKKSKPQQTWKDIGFDSAPEGYPTDEIALIDGLNKSRGSWTFEGTISKDDNTTPLKGKMEIAGSFKNGMVPMWKLALEWPGEVSKQMVVYMVLGSPEATGFELMLIRIGPMKPPAGGKLKQGDKANIKRTIFEGTWNLENRTITWKEKDTPAKFAKKNMPQEQQAETKETPTLLETFEMILTANGEITIKAPKHATHRQQIMGETVARVGKPYVEEKLAEKKSRYDNYSDVFDSRLKQCLPPGAVDITLHSERGGHFAKYKVSETDFHKFLNDLWKTKKQTSAHQRDEMHGEGEPVSQKKLEKRFEQLGWEPLKNAIKYYSPSKKSGAMTTYFYDRDAGIAYHDTNYW